MSTNSYLGCGLAVLLAAGCGLEGSASTPVEAANPTSFDHCKQSLRTRFRSENGRSLQGTQGKEFVALSVQSGCDSVEDLQLQGARLTGRIGNKQLIGADFTGTQILAKDESGTTIPVEIAQVEVDAADASGETFLYTLQYYDAQSGGMKNACLPDKDGVAKALPLVGSYGADGSHDKASGTFTFACTSGALAKCARWGYRPWQSYNGVSLADYHQTCTRMVRADYCGDGTSHTKDGTTVDIYDNLGMLVRGNDPLLRFEATWTTRGAYCISKQRWLELTGLLPSSCLQKFDLTLETTQVESDDVCFARRPDLDAADGLINNRSY